MFAECDELSLRVIVSVADGGLNSTDIETKTKIPASKLEGICSLLTDAKLIKQSDGVFTLCDDPNELTLYDALNRITNWQRWPSCPVDIDDHSDDLCPLHRRLENISVFVERQLRGSTVAALLSDPEHSRPLCNKLQES